jgi:hypothetical protein
MRGRGRCVFVDLLYTPFCWLWNWSLGRGEGEMKGVGVGEWGVIFMSWNKIG